MKPTTRLGNVATLVRAWAIAWAIALFLFCALRALAAYLPSANPSASVGLTAVNGTAGTAMLSDGAPAIDVSIRPTWTGPHVFNNSGSSNKIDFSGTTSSNVGLKDSGTELRVRKGDDSAYGNFRASIINAEATVNAGNGTSAAPGYAMNGGSYGTWVDGTSGAVGISVNTKTASLFQANKNLSDGAISLFEVALTAGSMTGGTITWTIVATDGTDVQSLSGLTTYSSVNKAGAYTDTITTNASNTSSALSSGTLTAAFSVVDGTNKITVKVTPAGSLTETTYRIYWNLQNQSQQAITTL